MNLAIQGGGAHGAFAWGVLDRLLEEERVAFEGISATSAGAMNAAVLAHGLTEGGREGARRALAVLFFSLGKLRVGADPTAGIGHELALRVLDRDADASGHRTLAHRTQGRRADRARADPTLCEVGMLGIEREPEAEWLVALGLGRRSLMPFPGALSHAKRGFGRRDGETAVSSAVDRSTRLLAPF